jgi:hypothetical protein
MVEKEKDGRRKSKKGELRSLKNRRPRTRKELERESYALLMLSHRGTESNSNY